jgi:xylose isomerase
MDYQPKPEHRFTFGLWTVSNPGADPFGAPVRERIPPSRVVENLARLGAFGVNLHDDDLIPPDSSPSERRRLISEFQRCLKDHGLVVPMATTNLFSDPVFRAGAFTAQNPKVRAYALQKTMIAMDLGAELGAEIYVFWGGREGSEVDAAGYLPDALARYREAINLLCAYSREQGYPFRFALEPKPNEPRGDLFLPTVGSMLGFIATLDHPEMVGVNPEFAHAAMAGLNFAHEVAQAIDSRKLFHVDLNDQRMGRFDQDLRFASENLKTAFFTVLLLEESGYQGPRHFDAHPLRTEDERGVWEFAKGCMRSYLILKEKAWRFAEDPEIQEARRTPAQPLPDLRELRSMPFDLDTLRGEGAGQERLDQLLFDLLTGVR